ncbi:hypothetical protein AC579_628 [Pseudocercospora musae]|uniref:Uncharacterized protein n=1 Tax=Pseudocercospora musae TaxID=113226 RepID=A0A139HQ02_9PEZI|nr:hypothetical protein AC579_628 [Pseudocercospora musae]
MAGISGPGPGHRFGASSNTQHIDDMDAEKAVIRNLETRSGARAFLVTANTFDKKDPLLQRQKSASTSDRIITASTTHIAMPT